MHQPEATVAQAIERFPHQGHSFRPLGWKDHAFEFLTYWNGDLGCPTAPWQKMKRLEQYDGHDLQIATFVSLDGPPILFNVYPALASTNYDDNSKRQHLMDGWRPVVITRHLIMFQFFGAKRIHSSAAEEFIGSQRSHTFSTMVEVRQTTFAHAPGGRELAKSDGPLFMWNRYEVVRRDLDLGPAAETVHVGLQFSRSSITPAMTTFNNAHFKRPAARYAHPLVWKNDCLYHEDDGLVRLGLASEALNSDFRPDLGKAQFQTQSPHDFLTAEFPCHVGSHLDVLIPLLAVSQEDFDKEKSLGYELALEQTHNFWDGELARGAEYSLPEPLAHNTVRAAPWQALTIAERHPQLDMPALVLGAYGYDGVWATSSCLSGAYSLDYLGFHEDAERYLDLYLAPKEPVSPPGKFFVATEGFLTTPKPYESVPWVADHGAVLWAVATHDLLTADDAFWKKWEPRLLQGLEWIAAQRGVSGHGGHMGITPPGQATDDDIEGQFVWNDAWLYKGLTTACVALARRGHPQAARWQAEAKDYHQAFNQALRSAVERRGTWTDRRGRTLPFMPTELTGNLIQDGIDQHMFYLDTGPLVLPWSGLLDWHDPLVDATLQWLTEGPYAKNYVRESSYGQNPTLIHEMSSCEPSFSWNIFSRLMRNERHEFIEGLTSILAGGQERSVLSTVEHRHGMFALLPNIAIIHMRNAYVLEDMEQNALHLFRAVPQEHLKAGDQVSWHRLPTFFGPIDIEIKVGDGGRPVKAEIGLPSRQAPNQVVIHPLSVEGGEAPVINGQRHDAAQGPLVISPVPKQLSILWD